ncbi:MAG: DUF2974 domain-containing protein [Lachnospiraceae bacterium]|jgi:hypothetical protein|nr:DUF2974 domain-containing protein [Lachnospiraceae bacterium]
MANMISYLDWRGDLTFMQSRFNEVDNLILAQMCYAPLEDLVCEDGSEPRTVEEIANAYFEKYSEEKRAAMDSQEMRATQVLARMAQSNRFRYCTLSFYRSQTDVKMEKQFAAVVVDIGTDAIYLAYRGTDNTLIGWKEDFNMCYASHLQAQTEALSYFTQVAEHYAGKKYFLGGHSKGGNLAVYAAIMCNEQLKKRIIRVYNNDGPGFRRDIIETSEYRQILPKIRTIVPESSIVGMLLEHEEEYTVVRSSQSGGMQHDATSWEVLGRHFIYLEAVSEGSRRIDKTITAWLSELSQEDLKETVDALFSVLMAAGFSTVSSIQKEPLKNALTLLREMNHLEPEKKKLISGVISSLVKEGNRTVRKAIPLGIESEEEP